jgi:hypothetical protein
MNKCYNNSDDQPAIVVFGSFWLLEVACDIANYHGTGSCASCM